ncbi:MAG TPA: GNAT family N-acetyltransferase [Myxococcaceae bacterium]|nr:GNAT family N-acetyltransferase [Myxococcaceae bacterium]
MSLFVRRLKVQDFPLLDALEAAVEAQSPERAGWLRRCRKLLEVTVSEEPEGLLVAELDGRIAGWAAARQRGTDPMTGETYGHILHVSVAPDGGWPLVGARLFREAEAYLRSRGCRSVHASIPADVPEASSLLKRAGYRVAGFELTRDLA